MFGDLFTELGVLDIKSYHVTHGHQTFLHPQTAACFNHILCDPDWLICGHMTSSTCTKEMMICVFAICEKMKYILLLIQI